MPGGYLYGWDSTNEKWVKLICDANGKLKMDTALLLENPPTEDEDKKAATSEWSFDHEADVAAHHAKFTAAEARASISNIFGSDGHADANIWMDGHYFYYIRKFIMRWDLATPADVIIQATPGSSSLRILGDDGVGGNPQVKINLWDGTAYQIVCTENVADSKIATHKAIAAAHHTKYTNLEAQTACNLNGGLHWSCSGLAFATGHPDVDDVTKFSTGKILFEADDISAKVQANLPDCCTISSVMVYGNENAEAKTYALRRHKLVDNTYVTMGTQTVNTPDITISYPEVDNAQYSYVIVLDDMDTDEEIWGAVITYTL